MPSFPPAYAFGGPAKVAYQVSKELVKKGHEVVVYASDAKDFCSRLRIDSDNDVDGIRVHRFRNLSLTLVKKFKLFITPQLVSRAKEEVEKFDVIHLHEHRTFQNIVTAYYAKKYGVPYVLQAHGSLPRIMAWRRLKWIYDTLFGYRLLRDASKVIALSSTEAKQYRDMGVSDEKIAIIPNGIDLSEYVNLPPKGSFKEKFGISTNKKMILFLGRVHKTKGIDLLISAYSELLKITKSKETVLVIVGPDDGYAGEAMYLARRLGISNSIYFIGFVSPEDKQKALIDAEVFVTPSFSGFPLTFLEACAAGVPIVTTTLGDRLNWIDKQVGFVTSPAPSDLSKAIYAILQDQDLRKRFSRNCKSVVESNFSIDIITRSILKLYEEILSKT